MFTADGRRPVVPARLAETRDRLLGREVAGDEDPDATQAIPAKTMQMPAATGWRLRLSPKYASAATIEPATSADQMSMVWL